MSKKIRCIFFVLGKNSSKLIIIPRLITQKKFLDWGTGSESFANRRTLTSLTITMNRMRVSQGSVFAQLWPGLFLRQITSSHCPGTQSQRIIWCFWESDSTLNLNQNIFYSSLKSSKKILKSNTVIKRRARCDTKMKRGYWTVADSGISRMIFLGISS